MGRDDQDDFDGTGAASIRAELAPGERLPLGRGRTRRGCLAVADVRRVEAILRSNLLAGRPAR